MRLGQPDTAWASALAERHRKPSMPGIAVPADAIGLEQAFRIQHEVTRQLGTPIGGWKTGPLSGGHRTFGAVFAERISAHGVRALAGPRPVEVESEIGFRLRHDLPPAGRPYPREAVAQAVSQVFPVFELASSRLADFAGASLAARVADNLAGHAMVLGRGVAEIDLLQMDLSALRVELTVNGVVVADRIGGKPGDDPFSTLCQFANSRWCASGLRRGDVIITGSWTGSRVAAPGDGFALAFSSFEPLTLHFENTESA
jgi:2-keto-4-pentenoate hydratase